MSLQSQFESMVVSRNAPTSPQFNPADTDVTRGLQVASFALDTVGQAVRSKRESEASGYASQAQNKYSEVYAQTGSSVQAMQAVNKFAETTPAWARGAVGQAMGEQLGYTQMAIQNDRLMQQDARAQEAARIQQMDDAQKELLGEIEGNEEFANTLRVNLAYRDYKNSAEGSQGEVATKAEFSQQLLQNPEYGQYYQSVAGLSNAELAEVGYNNRAATTSARGAVTVASEYNRLLQSDKAAQMQRDSDEFAAANNESAIATQSIVNTSRTQSLFEVRQVDPENLDESTADTGSYLRQQAEGMRRLGSGIYDDSQKDQLIAEAERLEGLAEQIEGLPQLETAALQRAVTNIGLQTQLSEESVLRLQALYGEAATGATLQFIVQSTDVESEVSSTILSSVRAQFDGGNDMTQAEVATEYASATDRVLSGGGSPQDWDVVGTGALGALSMMSQGGYTPQEMESIQEHTFPLIFGSSILGADTVQGRENSVRVYSMLKDSIEEGDLSEDELAVWSNFKVNAQMHKTFDDGGLIDNIQFINKDHEDSVNLGGYNLPASSVPNSNLARSVQWKEDWVDNSWVEVQEAMQGTEYGDVLNDPDKYLSFVMQVNGKSTDSPEFDQLGRDAVADLLDREGGSVTGEAEQVQSEQAEVYLRGKSLQELAVQQLTENREFFGVKLDQTLKVHQYTGSDGQPRTTTLIDMGTLSQQLKEYEFNPEEEVQISAPTPEDPTPSATIGE